MEIKIVFPAIIAPKKTSLCLNATHPAADLVEHSIIGYQESYPAGSTLESRRAGSAQPRYSKICILDLRIFAQSFLLHLLQAFSGKMGNKMSKFTSSSEPGLDSTNIASSNEIPPFYRLTERNPSKTLRKVYAMYQPLNALFRIPIPGTLHWGVNVVSDEELAEDDPGYVWELAQEKGKITINVSSWTGAAKMRKELLGSTNLTDRKICDHGW